MIIGFISMGCILLGAGAVLLLLSKKAKSLSDDDITRLVKDAMWYRRLERWWHERVRENLESGTFEQQIRILLEKVLRQAHVMLLRADNRLHALIQRTRENRSQHAIDKEYWATIQNFSLEKKIEKLFHDIKKNYRRDALDPVHEEHLLIEDGISDPERWFNLIRFYIAKDHVSEARRIIIQYWLQNKQDENVFILLEGVLAQMEIQKSKTETPSSQGSGTEL